MSDPIFAYEASKIVLSSASKIVIEPIITRLLKKANIVSEAIKDDFHIQGQEVSVICPKSIQQIDLYFNIENRLSTNRRRFYGAVNNVSLKSFGPYEDLTDKAIVLHDDGFEIFYKYLDPARTYHLKTDYYIDNAERLINDWIYTKVSHESPKGEDEIYWLEAHFRAFDQFKRMYDKFELIDMDFKVKVLIDNHVKTAIPKGYEKEIQTVRKWMRSRDREEKARLSHQHMQQQGKKGSDEDAADFIRKLQELFTAHHFKQFIDLSQNFKQHDILRGSEIGNAVPYLSWPEYMNVIARTNLSKEHRAISGKLTYKYKSFQDAVSSCF